MNLAFGSVCSGIEAASVAWHPLGWSAAWLAEIEPFPSAVLAHHYPDVPNLGDMTTIAKRVLIGEVSAPDLLCGGTPCQAFSVAGLRASLDDERGNLTLKFVELADAIDHIRVRTGRPPAVIVWENVPGVLSTKDNAFGCFLAGLAGESDPLVAPGGKWGNAGYVLGPQRAVAWRVLDAQYFGLAQRRRRVFVVASARDGFDPSKVLFEFDGVRRDTAPSREAGKAAPTIPSRSTAGGGLGTDFDCDGGVIKQPTFCIKGAAIGRKPEAGPQHGEVLEDVVYTQNCVEQHAVAYPIAFNPVQDPIYSTDESTHAVGCGSSKGQASIALAYAENQRADVTLNDTAGTVTRGGGKPGQGYTAVLAAMQVRRITPRECERLQGFADDYTAIPWRGKPAHQCPDGPRYKALGNSWAVPVARWIGQRIQAQLEPGI